MLKVLLLLMSKSTPCWLLHKASPYSIDAKPASATAPATIKATPSPTEVTLATWLMTLLNQVI